MDTSQPEDIPQHFLCPITLAVMNDPVIDNDGVSYERQAISEWLNAGNSTSPTTGKELTVNDLRPNRALREAIEKHLGVEGMVHSPPRSTESMPESGSASQPQTTLTGMVIDQASSSQVSVELDFNMKYDGHNMLISIEPPESTQCVRSSICCVVDVSGSMGTEATIQNEKGETETFGLSVLDVTKHALKTIVKSLTPQDEFSLVTFCSTVSVELEPRLMTPAAVENTLERIDGLCEHDMTNLWGGLKKGLELLTESRPKTDNVALFLLTDGLPNIGPAKGESKTLEDFKKNNKGLPGRIHTFGFGYSMNSVMLSEVSSIGGGLYSFIPDCSFVGTVFVNAVANHITTAAYNLTLEVNGKNVVIEKGDHLAYGPQADDKSLAISFGSIQFGQTKDVVFPLKKVKGLLGQSKPSLDVTLKYYTGGNKKTLEKSYDWDRQLEQSEDIQYQRMRLALVKGIQDVLDVSGLTFQSHNFTARELNNKGRKRLGTLEKRLKELVDKNEPRSTDLLKDLTGQIAEAFSKDEWFFRWGAHFCLSITLAHLHQICNNFKDPGVQHYSSELFSETRDKLDEIFITLPAPKPSARTSYGGSNYRAAPVNMSSFMNFNSGCFLGSSLVHMAGQKFRRADQIKKGDKVFTGAGLIDEVECVLKTCYDDDEPQLLYRINENLVATAWHPVKNEAGQWTFPAESSSAKAITVYTEGVYTFLLKNRGTILLGDTECATLAHGLQGEVIEHEFLGTEIVAADLKRFDQFQSGLVEVTQEAFQRNPDTGRINAIRMN